MRRTTAMLAMAVGCLLSAPATGASEDQGRTLYLKYCGACHGPAGKGDGIAGTFMRPKPADLTKIAKQNGGEFPLWKTMEVIDGRNTPRAHGDPDMPVWGELFHEQASWDQQQRTAVQQKIRAIAEYLRTIQEK